MLSLLSQNNRCIYQSQQLHLYNFLFFIFLLFFLPFFFIGYLFHHSTLIQFSKVFLEMTHSLCSSSVWLFSLSIRPLGFIQFIPSCDWSSLTQPLDLLLFVIYPLVIFNWRNIELNKKQKYISPIGKLLQMSMWAIKCHIFTLLRNWFFELLATTK